MKGMNPGTKVEVRFSKSRRLSGIIARIDDETCDVDFDSGEKEKEIPLILVRSIESLPKEDATVIPDGDSGASENKISSSNDVLSIGDRVEAKFRGRGSRYYQGTIKNVTPEGKYDIDYDDGDRDRKLSAEHVRKLDGSIEKQRRGIVSRTKNNSVSTVSVDVDEGREKNATKESADDLNPTKHSVFSKGQRVMARYRGRGKRWYKGTIAECLESQQYTIHYDDGDRDRSLAAEFIRAIDDNLEVLQRNTTAAVRDINSGNIDVALSSEEESRKQATGRGVDVIIDDATKIQLEGTTVELTEPTVKEGVVIAPDDISAIVAPDAVDGDVSFVVDSGHKTRKESSTRDAVSGSCTEHRDQQSSANYSSGKGNRLYRGKIVKIKTIRLYEIEYPDSTADINIPFGALRLPLGYSESDIKVGTMVDVLSWQDRFAAVL